MKRILILLVALSLFLCSTASAFQGGGGESTKKGSSKKKEVTKKKNPGAKSANTKPPRTNAAPPRVPAQPVETKIKPPYTPAPTVQVFGPGRSIDLGNNVKLELVQINAGSFLMGSEENDSEKPAHRVTISQAFYIGKYEVTQAQWHAVMGSNPSRFKGDNLPVEQVSWNDAQSFLQKLNAMDDGFIYRLPTEAEWEYACRAGTTGDYAGSLEAMAWYGNNSGRQHLDALRIWVTDRSDYARRITDNANQTHLVGEKQPNGFGLYDMHGNVWEWCQDRYHENYNGAPVNESGWDSGGKDDRVLRGGSWVSNERNSRSAVRVPNTPDDRNSNDGFRVVAVKRAT